MHGTSYRPSDLYLIKGFSKKFSLILKIFIIFFEENCPWQWSMYCSIGWVQLDIPSGIYCNSNQVSWSYLQSLRKLYQQMPLDQNQTTVGIPNHKTWPIILIFYIDWYIFQYLHKLATFWTLTWNISVEMNYLLFCFLSYFHMYLIRYYKLQRSNQFI